MGDISTVKLLIVYPPAILMVNILSMIQCILNALSMKAAAENNYLFRCTSNLDLNPFQNFQLI